MHLNKNRFRQKNIKSISPLSSCFFDFFNSFFFSWYSVGSGYPPTRFRIRRPDIFSFFTILLIVSLLTDTFQFSLAFSFTNSIFLGDSLVHATICSYCSELIVGFLPPPFLSYNQTKFRYSQALNQLYIVTIHTSNMFINSLFW